MKILQIYSSPRYVLHYDVLYIYFFAFSQSAIVGSKVEREIVTSLAKNKTLLNFGMGFDTQGPRIACAEILVRNNDFRKF